MNVEGRGRGKFEQPATRIEPAEQGKGQTSDGLCRTFADNLTKARKHAGLKSYAAAHILGVSKSTWSQWESGKRFPNIPMLAAIADCLNVSPCSLLRTRSSVCYVDIHNP